MINLKKQKQPEGEEKMKIAFLAVLDQFHQVAEFQQHIDCKFSFPVNHRLNQIGFEVIWPTFPLMCRENYESDSPFLSSAIFDS